MNENENNIENLPYVKDSIYSRNNKVYKNSMILLNNRKRNINNKSMINRSLMQGKQDPSSSFSESNSSQGDDNIISSSKKDSSSKKASSSKKEFKLQTEDENQNSHLMETKSSAFDFDFIHKFKRAIANNVNDPQKKNFVNGMTINKTCPIKNTTNSVSFDQNGSYYNSIATNSQINQTTTLEETQNQLVNHNHSPKVFNKTIEKFKSFLNNDPNKKKIIDKYQNAELNSLLKKNEKKLVDNFIGKKEDKGESTPHTHDSSCKIQNESLIKKNHELQIENFNLKNKMKTENANFNLKMKKLSEVLKKYVDKNINVKFKFDIKDLDFFIEKLERHLNQGILDDAKEKILTQFDNLRDYYRV